MTDSQVDYLYLLLTAVRVEIRFVESETTSYRVSGVISAHKERPDDPDEPAEPVAVCPGYGLVSLWTTGPGDFRATPDVAIWPGD